MCCVQRWILRSHMRAMSDAVDFCMIALTSHADRCIANCDSRDQANCISSNTCSKCNAGYFGATCQAHTCIENCDSRDQANCISDTTCAVCNAGFLAAHALDVRRHALVLFAVLNPIVPCIAQCNNTLPANCDSATTCLVCNAGYELSQRRSVCQASSM